MKFILFVLVLCVIIPSLLAVHQCEKEFFKTKYYNFNEIDSVLLIWFPANAGTQNTLHVCSNDTGLPLQRRCSYDRSSNAGKWEEINRNIHLINCSNINNQCREEPFQHNYIMKNGLLKPFNNTWKAAKLMERADLQEPCLLSTGLPITRLCKFNAQQMQTEWELLSPEMRNISCLRETREDLITYDLNSLYQEVKNDEEVNKMKPEKVVDKMTELLTMPQTVRVPADIKISSDILKIVTENLTNPELLTGVLNVTDIIMATDRQTIIKSDKVNATTTLLKTIDKYLHNIAKVLVPTDQCKNITDGIVYKTFERTSVFYINPGCSNISGVAIYHSNTSHHSRHHHRRGHHQHQRYDAHTGQNYRFLYFNQTLDQILVEPNLRLATYFPLSLWNKLKTETSTIDNQTVLYFRIYKNDLLFVNRTKMDHKPDRRVLEISIPTYSGVLPEDIPFILSYRTSRHRSQQPPICGYWNYSTWTANGIKTEYKNISDNKLLICHSTHLTHFASIFGISSLPSLSLGDSIILSISHDLMLDYISILGCGLSLFGLSCIWLTAMCFRSWRSNQSNKVLLNMCLVLTLLMLFFLLLNLPQLWKNYIDMKNSLHCRIMGGYLHYNVLVLFSWMLIIAIMQYQRYVRVIGYERPSNFITKYALLAWSLPLIPTLLVAFLEPNTYMPDAEKVASNNAICYPNGNSLYYGVILPMAAIMLTNLGIFIYIFHSLRRSLCKFKHQNDRKRIVIQIRVSILLFFLLGISWIFGFLSHLDNSPLFSYLFCLTSTLQGFVLFLYFIIIDKSTRTSWIIFCCAKNYNTMEDSNLVPIQSNKSR